MVSFNFYNHPLYHLLGKYFYPYFANNKAESEGSESTCLMSHSSQVAEQELKPNLSHSKVSVSSVDHNISSIDDNKIHYSREAKFWIPSKFSKEEFLDN